MLLDNKIPQTLEAWQTEICRLKTENDLLNRKIAGSEERSGKAFHQDLKALHDIGIELAAVETVDALCRLAVERGIGRLGFDRLSIWLVEDDPDIVSGTYGTDESGHIRPENDKKSSIPQAFRQKYFEIQSVGIQPDWPLLNHLGEEVGRGWHLTAALRDGEQVVGFIYADNLLSKQPLREDQPELLSLYGATIGQLYARAKAQTALRMREEHFRMLLENSSDVICLFTEDGKLRYRSPAGERVFGYPMEERLNQSVFDIVHPDDLPVVKARFQELLTVPHAKITLTYRGRHKAGTWRWLETSLTNLLCENSIRAIVANTRDVTERKLAEQQLEAYLKQLRDLTGHLQSVQEKERAHIAREVHDELGQGLTGLKLETSWLKRHLCRTSKAFAPEEACQKLDGMTELIDSTIQSVRRIATELRPAVLDTLGLASALEWQAQEFQKRTGIRCDFTAEVEEVSLDRAASTAVFRIFQETLTNIARHAQAHNVEAHLKEDEAGLTLEVQDDGVGISAPQFSEHASFGLLGMQERALLLGGELTVKGEPGQGTTVILRIPLQHAEDQEKG